MLVDLRMSPNEEAQFADWAARHGDDFAHEAQTLYRSRSVWETLAMLFLKASALLYAVLDSNRDLAAGTNLLLMFQTMVALHHANSGRPYTWAELHQRTRLEDAMTLYDLEVISLEVAAHVAGVSQSALLDALCKAGIPALQYSADEAFAEAQSA
jgi:predicted HTH domain antitoxin